MKTTGAICLATLAALSIAAPAMAVDTPFASFLPVGNAFNVRYQQTGTNDGLFFTTTTPGATVVGAVGVRFRFLGSVLADLGVLDAGFTDSSVVNDNTALSTAGLLVQNIDSGTLRFTYTGLAPLVVGSSVFTTGANLLTASFTNGNLFGTVQGASGSVLSSTPLGTIIYTSDFLTFDPASSKDFALALTSITPLLNRVNADSSVATFRALAAGVFSTESVTTVPEPETWALLIAGFVMVGAAARRHRNAAVSA